MTTPSVGDMIAKYHEIKAYVETEQAKADEHLKPFKEAMRTLQTACGVALQQQNLQNFKSEDGTAYLKHSDGIKVDSEPEFLNFVRVNERWDMATIGVLVDPVREYLDKKGTLPPGVTSSPSVTCIIRK